MSEEALYKNLFQLGAGIEACIDRKATIPALVLIYTAIDITGWLNGDDPNTKVRDRFTNWVDQYLLSAKPLRCTSIDLYAARCGLVHTFTPDSRLSDQGQARRICYARGNTKSDDLQQTIKRMNKTSEYVAIHVEELYEAWRLGLLAFTEELAQDPTRASRVYARAKKFFSTLSTEVVGNFLDLQGNE